MRKIIPIAALSVAVLLIGQLAVAAGDEIYRWKDANGVTHYSDQPQPGAELIKSGKRPANNLAPPPPPAPAAAETISSDNSAPPLSREVAQQVRQEAATAKADQCKKQQEAYQRAVQARRIVKVDEKGNKVFLNDAEIDAARLEARANRDRACDPAAP